MSNSTVVVEGVSKRFELHQARSGSFRDMLGRRQSGEQRPEKEFWALKDINFTVEPGHPLAIIGHNGSGKSTMLKLLTGILKPTTGNISIHGRVGALIEVGAGFHPDLTGRENVYLNGSILGATKREMDARFDQIVAFAGLERFIDTPVKRYSSGMFMRLGFSIAAHIEPEVLLIDEVLAVGDAQFQSRCLGFLKRFVAKGGSVVFVSHAMAQVQMLCDRVLWLDHGQPMGFGEAAPLIERYESLVAEREDAEFQRLYPEEWEERQRQTRRAKRLGELLELRDAARVRRAEARIMRAKEKEQDSRNFFQSELLRLRTYEARFQTSQRGELLSLTLTGESGQNDSFRPGERIEATIRYNFRAPFPDPVIGLDIFRADNGMHVFTTSNYDAGVHLGVRVGLGEVTFTIQALCLPAGQYRGEINVFSDWSHPTRPDWHELREHELTDAACFVVRAEHPTPGLAWMPVEKWQ